MIKLVLEYDGAGFVGWQRQLTGPGVQEAVEMAIASTTPGVSSSRCTP